MNDSRKAVLGLTLALAVFGAHAVVFGPAGPLQVFQSSQSKGAADLAMAACGVIAYFSGRRVCNVYLVAVGLLLMIDAFTGLTRGVFYLDFATLNGPAPAMDGAHRLMASLPHFVLGALATYAGLHFANRDAKAKNA